MTPSYNFHVCLDNLSALRRSLADLETSLSAATHQTHTWPLLDPRIHTGPAAWRTTKGDTATYVYGLLDEAEPLGDTHADIIHRLQTWYTQIQDLLTAIKITAERTHATYTAADETTATAAHRTATQK